MIYYNTTPVRVGKNWHLVVNGELCVVPILAGRLIKRHGEGLIPSELHEVTN